MKARPTSAVLPPEYDRKSRLQLLAEIAFYRSAEYLNGYIQNCWEYHMVQILVAGIERMNWSVQKTARFIAEIQVMANKLDDYVAVAKRDGMSGAKASRYVIDDYVQELKDKYGITLNKEKTDIYCEADGKYAWAGLDGDWVDVEVCTPPKGEEKTCLILTYRRGKPMFAKWDGEKFSHRARAWTYPPEIPNCMKGEYLDCENEDRII